MQQAKSSSTSGRLWNTHIYDKALDSATPGISGNWIATEHDKDSYAV